MNELAASPFLSNNYVAKPPQLKTNEDIIRQANHIARRGIPKEKCQGAAEWSKQRGLKSYEDSVQKCVASHTNPHRTLPANSPDLSTIEPP